MSTEHLGDMRTEYSKSLVALGEEDPNIVVLGADTTDSLKTSNFGKKFPERFFQRRNCRSQSSLSGCRTCIFWKDSICKYVCHISARNDASIKLEMQLHIPLQETKKA